MPAQVMGHDSVETLVLSNSTLFPVTTPAGNGALDKLYSDWFSRAGLGVELVSLPATRALEIANAGVYDGDAARTYIDTSVYSELRQVPEPVSRVFLHGFHTDPSVSVRVPADFKHYRVGYVRGWHTAETLFDGMDNALALRDASGLMDMLAADRLDIAFLSLVPARELAQERDIDPLGRTEFRIEMYQYLYLHAGHLDKIPTLVDTLRLMKSDGSYDTIMADYNDENQ